MNGNTKVGFLSDLHITYNSVPVDGLTSILISLIEENDLKHLIIAGDTSEDPSHIVHIAKEVNETLNRDVIYFIIGNHEYWGLGEYQQDLGPYYLDNKALYLNDNDVIIGTNGWADFSFIKDVEQYREANLPQDDEEIESAGRMVFDLSRLNMKSYLGTAKTAIDGFTSILEENKGKNIIAVSHYVPHRDFLVYKPGDYRWNISSAFMGSTRYEELARKHKISHWVFGHTHKIQNEVIDGTSYHCNPIGYRNRDREWTGSFEDEVLSCLLILTV